MIESKYIAQMLHLGLAKEDCREFKPHDMILVSSLSSNSMWEEAEFICTSENYSGVYAILHNSEIPKKYNCYVGNIQLPMEYFEFEDMTKLYTSGHAKLNYTPNTLTQETSELELYVPFMKKWIRADLIFCDRTKGIVTAKIKYLPIITEFENWMILDTSRY